MARLQVVLKETAMVSDPWRSNSVCDSLNALYLHILYVRQCVELD